MHNNEKTEEAFKRLKDTNGGRRIIAWVIDTCGINNVSFSLNNLENARNLALHDFCKEFLLMCGDNPSNFQEYLTEEENND
jgi:hypothetical protein